MIASENSKRQSEARNHRMMEHGLPRRRPSFLLAGLSRGHRDASRRQGGPQAEAAHHQLPRRVPVPLRLHEDGDCIRPYAMPSLYEAQASRPITSSILILEETVA